MQLHTDCPGTGGFTLGSHVLNVNAQRVYVENIENTKIAF